MYLIFYVYKLCRTDNNLYTFSNIIYKIKYKKKI